MYFFHSKYGDLISGIQAGAQDKSWTPFLLFREWSVTDFPKPFSKINLGLLFEGLATLTRGAGNPRSEIPETTKNANLRSFIRWTS